MNDDEHARRAVVDLKETEDLLAGFDRPGRTPRAPPVKRDFVDYHLEKRRSNPDVRPAISADREARDLPTAIIPGKRRRFPIWLPWAALLVAMSVGGVLVAASMLKAPAGGREVPSPSAVLPLPSSATTLASGAASPEPSSGPERDIPPPPPPSSEAPSATTDTVTVAATAPSAPSASTTPRRAPSSASAGSTPSGAAAPTPSARATPASSSLVAPPTTPDIDLIRNL